MYERCRRLLAEELGSIPVPGDRVDLPRAARGSRSCAAFQSEDGAGVVILNGRENARPSRHPGFGTRRPVAALVIVAAAVLVGRGRDHRARRASSRARDRAGLTSAAPNSAAADRREVESTRVRSSGGGAGPTSIALRGRHDLGDEGTGAPPSSASIPGSKTVSASPSTATRAGSRSARDAVWVTNSLRRHRVMRIDPRNEWRSCRRFRSV